MATHFHQYEDQAFHCNVLFCKLESKYKTFMEAHDAINAWTSEQSQESEVNSSEQLESNEIIESIQESFSIVLPKGSKAEERRKALYTLALFRWKDSYPEQDWASPEDKEDLPPIFSYVDENGDTVFFFNGKHHGTRAVFNREDFTNVIEASSIADNSVEISVEKITPAVAKKIFS